jgi:uncharacterized membrane protein
MIYNEKKDEHKWLHLLLLLGWLSLGIGLRFTNLGEKSPASIEISTLGFSLGHGFLSVPLEQVLQLDTLLSPLRFEPTTEAGEVIHHLINESNHPPLYFLLTHYWLKLFSVEGQLVTLWAGRSLSAILGVLSIPALFGLGWLAFRSRLVGQIAAALMAVSPYGIYLSQEARHYTLSILWIIASLSCLVVSVRCIYHRTPLPIWLGCVWVVVNSLGMATHYFFSLVLLAAGAAIGGFWLRDWRVLLSQTRNIASVFSQVNRYWWRIYAVAAGTVIGCLVWLPVVTRLSHDELTDWIQTSFQLGTIWQPIPRFFAWWITMIFLLPIEGTPVIVTILSGLLLLLLLWWIAPAVIRGIRVQMASPASRLSLWIVGGFLLGAMAIFAIVIYGLGKDLSKAARYHFVYFPAVLTLLGSSLAICWQERKVGKRQEAKGKKVVVAILLIGCLGALTVVFNYGFQKSQRADLLVTEIQRRSQIPVLIAMTYETHAELRELMAIAFEFKRLEKDNERVPLKPVSIPQFLLIKKRVNNSAMTLSTLTRIWAQIPRPFDLWAVTLKVDHNDLESLNCSRDPHKIDINGYRTQLYHC